MKLKLIYWQGLRRVEDCSWWAVTTENRQAIMLPARRTIRRIMVKLGLTSGAIHFHGPHYWGIYLTLPIGLKKSIRDKLLQEIESRTTTVG